MHHETGSEGLETDGALATTTDFQLSVHHGAQCDRRALLQRHHAVPCVSLGALRLLIQHTRPGRPQLLQGSEQANRSAKQKSSRSIHDKVLAQSERGLR